ncbi:MAG: Maf family protein [Phycisphaeraceae bacterium]
MPENPDTPRLILASRPPRRTLLLREAGYRFQQADPPFEDPPQPQPDARHPATTIAADLARQKASSLAEHVTGPALVLAADTICVGAHGRLLGQPATADEARQMIQGFLRDEHEVVTGVALLELKNAKAGEPDCFADVARVRFGPLSEQALADYLATDHWRGKAGGYNLADRQLAGWPIDVVGDPATVMGLPMRQLRPRLARHGVRSVQHPATDV